MKKEIEYSLKKFESALQKLTDGIDSVVDDLDKDGVIQRFEFTFELMWKTIKLFLEDKGILCRSPKDCLQQAYRYGLLNDESLFLRMLNDRNKTSRLYDQESAAKIFENIKKEYSEAFTYLLTIIQKNTI